MQSVRTRGAPGPADRAERRTGSTRGRGEMDGRTADLGDDGSASLQLDLRDTGSCVAQFAPLSPVGRPQAVETARSVVFDSSQLPCGDKLHISGQRPAIRSLGIRL